MAFVACNSNLSMALEAKYRNKQITIRSRNFLGSLLHYQHHDHRIMLTETIKVTIEKRTEIVAADESIHIQPDRTYQLVNTSLDDLLLLEI